MHTFIFWYIHFEYRFRCVVTRTQGWCKLIYLRVKRCIISQRSRTEAKALYCERLAGKCALGDRLACTNNWEIRSRERNERTVLAPTMRPVCWSYPTEACFESLFLKHAWGRTRRVKTQHLSSAHCDHIHAIKHVVPARQSLFTRCDLPAQTRLDSCAKKVDATPSNSAPFFGTSDPWCFFPPPSLIIMNYDRRRR